MKRIMALIIVFVLFLNLTAIPIAINADNSKFVYQGDTYYKFTFGENGTAYRGDYINGQVYTYKNNEYYTLWDTTTNKTTSVKENTIYDLATGENIDIMEISAAGIGQLWHWVPLKADGTPFEVMPDASHTVNIKMYVKNLASYGQMFVYACGPNTNIPTSAETNWQTGLFTTMGSSAGVLNDRQNISGPVTSGSIRYAGTNNYVFDSFDSSDSFQYYSGVSELITDNNAVYDAENNSYSFTFDMWTSKKEGNSYINDQKIGDRVYNNYFYLGGSAKSFTVDGVTYVNTWEIAEIEIIYNDPEGIDESTYNADFNSLPYANAPQNYYMPDTGASVSGEKTIKNNVSVIDAADVTDGLGGKVVKYDHLKGSYCSSHTTSFSVDYIAYNAVALGKNIELQKGCSYKVTVDYKAERVDAPLQLGIMMASTNSNIWTGSVPKGCLSDYTISETTDDWVTATYYITVPQVYDVNVYNGVSTDRKYAAFYVKPMADENIMVYFDNLTITEIPTVSVYDEYGNETLLMGEVGSSIPFEDFSESFDINGADGRGDTVLGYDYYLDADYNYVVNKETAVFSTKRSSTYYKKYKKLYNANDEQLSFCGFENSTQVTPTGFKDTVNGYVIGNYDQDYVITENGEKTIKIESFMIAGLSGFYADNFALAEGGNKSAKALKYKSSGKSELKYNVADISNGVLLSDNITYRLDFFYKAEGDSTEPLTFAFLNMRNGESMGQSTELVITNVKSDWTQVSLYLTTDFALCEKNSGYSGETFCIPAIMVNDNARTVYMDSFSISRVMEKSGASVLNDNAASTAGGQAIRFCFSYSADAFGNLIANGQKLSVQERGILFTGVDSNLLTVENKNNKAVIFTAKTENFTECWNYENGMLTYSTYVKDFSFTDSRTIFARGYVILEDGTTAYSDITEYSLDDILEINSLKENVNEYSLTDTAVAEKVIIQGATQKVENGYTFDWTGATLKIRAKAVGEVKVYFENLMPSQYFTVYLDGACISDLLLPQKEEGSFRYFVAFDVGSSNKEKIIEVSRQQEAMYDSYEVVGFSFAGELLKAEENDMLIEFIGDSITAGMGVIGTKTDWRTDGTNAWGYLTAQSLGVDFRIRAKSGIGAGRGADGSVGAKNEWISSYPLENCFRDLTTAYTVNREADIIIINLGTNDLNAYNWSPNASQKQELTDSYIKLLGIIRSYNPNAKIICLAGGMTNSYKTCLQNALNSVGGSNENFFYYEVTSGLTAGGAGHPTEYQQRIIANEIIEILQRDFLK